MPTAIELYTLGAQSQSIHLSFKKAGIVSLCSLLSTKLPDCTKDVEADTYLYLYIYMSIYLSIYLHLHWHARDLCSGHTGHTKSSCGSSV